MINYNHNTTHHSGRTCEIQMGPRPIYNRALLILFFRQTQLKVSQQIDIQYDVPMTHHTPGTIRLYIMLQGT